MRQYVLVDDTSKSVWSLKRSSETTTLHYAIGSDGIVSLDGLTGRDTVRMRLRPVDWRKFPVF
jgi:hypothetical protein